MTSIACTCMTIGSIIGTVSATVVTLGTIASGIIYIIKRIWFTKQNNEDNKIDIEATFSVP
jgi:hypothetical protein